MAMRGNFGKFNDECSLPQKKIALILGAMGHFAEELQNLGWRMIVSLPHFVRGKVSTNLGAIQ